MKQQFRRVYHFKATRRQIGTSLRMKWRLQKVKLTWIALSVLAFSLGTAGLATAKAYSSPQGPPPPGADQDRDRDHGGWDAPPQEFRDIQRQGFHDGIEGARKDFDNHRRPDVENRDEFRHPHVARSARQDYREGFRRGYETAMSHLMGDRHDHDRP
jgi:hypothetical protein